MARPLQGERSRILLLGDSITQQAFSLEHSGWGAGLADWYCRTADVTNRGFSGYNSRWVLDMMPQLLPRVDPTLLFATIFFGANDAVTEGGVQHVPRDEFALNLRAMVAHIKARAPQCVIILISPPTVDTGRWPTRTPEAASIYAEAVHQVVHGNATNAAIPNVALVDLTSLTTADLHDGLHLNASGNAKLLALLQGLLRSEFSHLCPPTEGEGGESVALPLHYPPCKSFFDGDAQQALESIRNWRW